jgi:hypothetical protein
MRSTSLLSLLALYSVLPTAASAQTLDGQMQHMQHKPAMVAPAQPQQAQPVNGQPANGQWPALNQQAMPAQPAPAQARIDSEGNGAIPALPLQVMDAAGIHFINGGIGDEEREQLKAQENEYNVQVMLSAPNGEFISNVRLRLMDAKGAPLVDVADAGPYFFVKLAPGTYTLETTNPGEAAKQVKIKAPAKGALKKHIVYNQ